VNRESFEQGQLAQLRGQRALLDDADVAPEKLTADLHEEFASPLDSKLRSAAPSVSVNIELAK
jgi:hypothetical protein